MISLEKEEGKDGPVLSFFNKIFVSSYILFKSGGSN